MDIKGYTYGFYQTKKGDFASEEALFSRQELIKTGVNWVCFAFYVTQKHYYDTEIVFDYKRNVPDYELEAAIKDFHDKGIKVCLKPMINIDDGAWRARIDFPDDAELTYWDEWFASYTAYLEHYAYLAQRTGCEMFCLGCEMLGTERKEAHWRSLIAAIRAVYKGPLTYNTNHGEELKANWYDAIDIIGTSGYFPVEKQPGASVAEMQAEWEKIADDLEKVSKKWNKPLMFAEIGCRSAYGCAQTPWDEQHDEYPIDQDEQASFMESCLNVFTKREWFSGFFWWCWSTKLYSTQEEADRDFGFNIYKKKAQKVIEKFYNE